MIFQNSTPPHRGLQGFGLCCCVKENLCSEGWEDENDKTKQLLKAFPSCFPVKPMRLEENISVSLWVIQDCWREVGLLPSEVAVLQWLLFMPLYMVSPLFPIWPHLCRLFTFSSCKFVKLLCLLSLYHTCLSFFVKKTTKTLTHFSILLPFFNKHLLLFILYHSHKNK